MVELKTVETVDTSPFKKLIITIGELPTSFVESMTYYECLAWLVNYIQNTVIPAVNNNGEAVTELQGKFVELNEAFTTLKNYVDTYFDNLDVQEEVNTKLDAMAEDGTLASLISTQILGDLSTLHTTDKSSIVAAVNETYDDLTSVEDNVETQLNTFETNVERQIGDVVMNQYRKENNSRWNKVTLPNTITESFFNDFDIYTNNGKKYLVEFDENKFKNTNGSTYYIATNGNNNTGDGTEANPYATIYKVLQVCNAGDTIIMKNGIYTRSGMPSADSTKISKSINIIGESENGVWIKQDDNYTWTQDSDYSNVFYTSRTGVSKAIDIRRRNEGVFINLTQVYSKEDCATTENSYYYASPLIYINQGGITPSNDTVCLTLGLGQPLILAKGFGADSKIYLENINVLNSDRGTLLLNNDSAYTVNVYIKNCKFYNNNSTTYAYDSISNIGCNTICYNVICNNTGKDGFNYHAGTYKQANGIEINCKSVNCGYGLTQSGQLSNNATTAHNESQVIRINGIYADSNGGSVVDIEQVKSVLYGCTIFDSYGSGGRDYDLYAAGTCVMYVIDCYFKGSTAGTNMKALDTSYIYYNSGTEFDTKSGDNVILIQ